MANVNPFEDSDVVVVASSSDPLYIPQYAVDHNKIPNSTDSTDLEDSFWYFAEIDNNKWNKTFPYQLIVLQFQNGGYSPSTEWPAFTLPINPQDISITMPFAINNTIMLNGIAEEHNGAPIRHISFTGTTGVLPLRGSGKISGTTPLPQAIFAGTIQSSNNILSALGRPPTIVNLVDETAVAPSSGYAQFLLLQRFLESYSNIKKTKAGKDLRLALAIWKDSSIYLVTPLQFELRRTMASPNEFPYTLSFRAWRRINMNDNTLDLGDIPYTPVKRDPNALADLLNRVNAARSALQNVGQTFGAISADIDHSLFEPLRQVAFFAQDAIGVGSSMAELPASIISSLTGTVANFFAVPGAASSFLANAGNQATSAVSDLVDLLQNYSALTGSTESGFGTLQQPLGNQGAQSSDPVNTAFASPNENYAFFSLIKPSQLNIPLAVNQQINAEKRRIRNLTRADFADMLDNITTYAADLADALGLGSPVYDRTYNRTFTASTRTPTDQDFDVLYNLNEVIIQLNKLVASSSVNNNTTTALDLFASSAHAAGMPFIVPLSKFAVPFPYGMTLEQLAVIYLKDPDRWIEIAAINNLKEPYIDEQGFNLPLLTNAKGNSVVVSDSSNLFIGQRVILYSNTVVNAVAHIVGLQVLSDGTSTVTLDGGPWDSLYLADNATLHAWLPNTINSQMYVLIPSSTPSSNVDNQTNQNSLVNQFDQYLQVGGVDLLLSSNNDIIVTPDGDSKLAYGLTNIIQKVRLALLTPRGSLLHHLAYGLGLKAGTSIADTSAKQILAIARDLFKGDPTFTGVTSAQVIINGPTVQLTLTVGIAGTNGLVPVTTTITL